MCTSMKLLIASKDDGLFHSLEEALSAKGFSILRAHDAEEARQLVEAEALDLAFIDEDLSAGGESAAELLSRVRAIRPLVRRVLLTSGNTMESAVVNLEARRRAQGWLRKPLDSHQLDDVLLPLTSRAMSRPQPRSRNGGRA